MDSIYMDKQGSLAVGLGDIQQCNFSLGDMPCKVFFFRDPMVKPVGVTSNTVFIIYHSETTCGICTFMPGLNKLVVPINASAHCFSYVFSWGAEHIWGVEMSLGWNLAEITFVGEGSEQVITVLNHSPVSAQEVPNFSGVLSMASADAVLCANSFLNYFEDSTFEVYSNALQRFVPCSFVGFELLTTFVGSLSTDISLAEVLENKVTEVSDESTDDEYPSAKCVYDELTDVVRTGDITDVVRTGNITDVVRTTDIADVVRTTDIADVVRTGDITDVVRTGDITDVVRDEDITDFLVADDIADLAEVVPAIGTNDNPLVAGKQYYISTDADINLIFSGGNTTAPLVKQEIIVLLTVATNTVTVTLASDSTIRKTTLPTFAPGHYKFTAIFDNGSAGPAWLIDCLSYT